MPHFFGSIKYRRYAKEEAFARIRESGIPYGDNPREQENMKGPGMTAGAKGLGKAVYFKDPDGHVLEIKTY